MKIWMIWVSDADDPAKTVWLETAWDDDAVANNYDGWLEAVAKAEQEWGARFVRIAQTEVNIEAIEKSFLPVEA